MSLPSIQLKKLEGGMAMTTRFSALVLLFLFSATAYAEDGKWEYYPSDNPFRSGFIDSAVYEQGYDAIAFRPYPENGVFHIYVTYWAPDLDPPSSVIARLSLTDGRTGQTEYPLDSAWQDWQGTMQIDFYVSYGDLQNFESANSYTLDFGDKTIVIPMSGFSPVVRKAISAVQ